MSKSILVVDDDELMRTFMKGVLTEDGYAVDAAADGKSAFTMFSAKDYDLAITDLRMPDMTGVDLMQKGISLKPDTPWVIMTAYGSIHSAVEAMRTGAADYLTKPFKSPEELRHVVRRVLREAEAEEKIAFLSEELGKQYPPFETIFLGESMHRVLGLVKSVAPTNTSVLITGASGTGKELVARVIHQLSSRHGKPLVAIHCAALVDNLLESELFGHEKGAFTGAVATRKGRFEIANGGTVFLDEIGEISPSMQVKLLRVLQERVYERVGGTSSISVDIRVISATNKDLKAEVAAGRFREDLFYRLNVFPIHLPGLTERLDAILPLARYFAAKFAQSLGKKTPAFSTEAEAALKSYQWPGNIRELQNVIERAVILSDNSIRPENLNIEPVLDKPIEGGLLQVNEKELIQRTLADVSGNRKKAAELLGISLRTLQYRIKEYGLQ
ncbi:MAG TPA: sigma-54 dependent transcriptional regulator [Syntrophorhabdaceae bacterium]|nr:sigma-54 dependent transcriptional regulator [Syntrophorhabdaceae bacterium]